MKQLSGVDASFLYMETPRSFGHVSGLSIFERPDIPNWSAYDAFYRQLERRVFLGAQVLVVLEHQAGADPVDVEAALLDGRQFGLEGVVVERLRPGDVDLEVGGVGPGDLVEGERAEPEGAHDLVKVRQRLGGVRHGFPQQFEVLERLAPQVFVQFVRHGVE